MILTSDFIASLTKEQMSILLHQIKYEGITEVALRHGVSRFTIQSVKRKFGVEFDHKCLNARKTKSLTAHFRQERSQRGLDQWDYIDYGVRV